MVNRQLSTVNSTQLKELVKSAVNEGIEKRVIPLLTEAHCVQRQLLKSARVLQPDADDKKHQIRASDFVPSLRFNIGNPGLDSRTLKQRGWPATTAILNAMGPPFSHIRGWKLPEFKSPNQLLLNLDSHEAYQQLSTDSNASRLTKALGLTVGTVRKPQVYCVQPFGFYLSHGQLIKASKSRTYRETWSEANQLNIVRITYSDRRLTWDFQRKADAEAACKKWLWVYDDDDYASPAWAE
jgi:hypothetical protein